MPVVICAPSARNFLHANFTRGKRRTLRTAGGLATKRRHFLQEEEACGSTRDFTYNVMYVDAQGGATLILNNSKYYIILHYNIS